MRFLAESLLITTIISFMLLVLSLESTPDNQSNNSYYNNELSNTNLSQN